MDGSLGTTPEAVLCCPFHAHILGTDMCTLMHKHVYTHINTQTKERKHRSKRKHCTKTKGPLGVWPWMGCPYHFLQGSGNAVGEGQKRSRNWEQHGMLTSLSSQQPRLAVQDLQNPGHINSLLPHTTSPHPCNSSIRAELETCMAHTLKAALSVDTAA